MRTQRLNDIRRMLDWLEANDSIELPYELQKDFTIAFLSEVDAFRETVKIIGGAPVIDQYAGNVTAKREFGSVKLVTSLPCIMVCDEFETQGPVSEWKWKEKKAT